MDPRLQRIVFAYQASILAADSGVPSPSEAADVLFGHLSELETGSDQGHVVQALQEILGVVEHLPSNRSYDGLMIAAEVLAAFMLRSSDYQKVARAWAQRNHSSARTVVARAYSRVADHKPPDVDGEVLLNLAARLDERRSLNNKDGVTLAHVALAIAKLRDEPSGVLLIERLAERGRASRYVAAGAIASDVSVGPPPQYLSAVPGQPPPSRPPNRRLFWLLASLVRDEDPYVSEGALRYAQSMGHSWPKLWRRLADILASRAGPTGTHRSQRPIQDEAESPSTLEAARSALVHRTGRPWTDADLRALRPEDLTRAGGSNQHSRGLDFNLRFPGSSNAAAGVLTWDPDLLQQETAAGRAGEPLPLIERAPCLFISYRWSDRVDELGFFDFIAGSLFSRGYDIVFDRDPRHLDKNLGAGDWLLLMYGCTHYIPIITDEFLLRLEAPAAESSALHEEWALARKLSDGSQPLRWVAVWSTGASLPEPLTADSVVDVRAGDLWEQLDQCFPERQFQVTWRLHNDDMRTRGPMRRVDLRHALNEATADPNARAITARDVAPLPGRRA